VAFRWRIRHKLILGLGLVVLITVLLLAGTFKGLASYMATMKTMSSKLAELRKAYDLKNAVQTLAAKPGYVQRDAYTRRPEMEDGSQQSPLPAVDKPIEEQKKDLRAKLQAAREALESYNAQLEDTVNRGRDPEDGYRPRIIVELLRTDFADLERIVEAATIDPSATPNQTATPTPLRLQGPVNEKITALTQEANDLVQDVYDSVEYRLTIAKEDHTWSVWIVLSTSIVGVLLMTGLLRFFYTWVFFPVRDLERGAGRVAQGDFEHRIEVRSGDEMEDLAAAFNNMTTRLREMYRDLARQVNERSRQLVRSERLAGVGFLAAGVAHEINNPLASIAFCSEALEARLADLLASRSKAGGRAPSGHDQEVIVKYLKMIQEEAFRCKQITERLLEFSRSGERRREMTDLAELVQSVLDMAQHLQNRKGKQIVFEPKTPVHAWVNAQEIKSVVLNLVVNALDSMEEGGTLTITLRPQHEMAELVFADTGCGMTADVLENIFEPFFTRSRTGKGTGLGLTITHRIITQHGGEIEAASAGQGTGSTFTVRLPSRPVEEPKDQTEEGKAAGAVPRRRAAA
jgi:signal transduction histidine kinase